MTIFFHRFKLIAACLMLAATAGAQINIQQVTGLQAALDSKLGGQAEQNIASSATTDLGSKKTSHALKITGSVTITSFGSTATAGAYYTGRFEGALTLTHNASSLILPNAGSNITTAANDRFSALCLGSGNWIVTAYQKADGTPLAGGSGGSLTLTGDVTGSGTSPITTTLANIPTATPAAGSLLFTNIAAPATPAAGKGSLYVDSTSKNLAIKNDAGTVNHGVQTQTASASNWIRSISDAGAVAISQPAQADITGLTTADSPQFTAVNVGHATDTTVSRSAAGKIAVEAKAVPLMSGAVDLILAGPTSVRTWTGPDSDQTLLYSGGPLGTPSSGSAANLTSFPTLNQNSTGSAASLSISGQTGLMTVTGLASTNRVKTIRDAADTILELGGSYTPSGTWTSMALTTPSFDGESFSTAATVSAGTNAQGQGALTKDYNVVTTASNNPSGVTLPTATTGRRIYIVNKGANPINVYPASGGSIDALAANASIQVPVSGVAFLNASSTTQWYSDFNLTMGAPTLGTPASGTLTNCTFPTLNQNTTGSAATLTTSRNIWGQAFNGSADVTGSLTSVTDITGGASSMVLTAGTGNSRTLTLRSTTSGGTATAFLTGNADQSSTFGGNLSGTGAWTLTGGAGDMTITAGTGNSRKLLLQSTTSGGTATTFLTGNADQSITMAAGFTASGASSIGTGNAFTAGTIELGAATDTTIARSGAGDITVEGNAIYRAGGTDVPVSDGGTGASTLTNHGVLLGQGTSAIAATAAGTSGYFLQSGGASADPSYLRVYDQVLTLASDFTVTNAGLTNVTGMSFSVSTNDTWHVTLYYSCSANNTTGDIIIGLTASTATYTTTCSFYTGDYYSGSATLIPQTGTPFFSTTQPFNSISINDGDGVVRPGKFEFDFNCTANATINLQIGQATPASGRTSTIYGGAVMLCRRTKP